MSIAFLDTETVTLEPGPDVVWEIGVITRDDGRPDQEWRFQVRPNMAKAQPEALEISRFAARYELTGRDQALAWSPVNGDRPAKLSFGALALTVHTLLRGRSIFGRQPAYDTLRLGLFLRKQWGGGPNYEDPWHRTVHDVRDELAGYLWAQRAGQPADNRIPDAVFAVPRSTELLAKSVGISPDDYERHTALGDCRLDRALYDAVRGEVTR